MATTTAGGDDTSGAVVAGDDSVLEGDDGIADEDDEIPMDDDANANGNQSKPGGPSCS